MIYFFILGGVCKKQLGHVLNQGADQSDINASNTIEKRE